MHTEINLIKEEIHHLLPFSTAFTDKTYQRLHDVS